MAAKRVEGLNHRLPDTTLRTVVWHRCQAVDAIRPQPGLQMFHQARQPLLGARPGGEEFAVRWRDMRKFITAQAQRQRGRGQGGSGQPFAQQRAQVGHIGAGLGQGDGQGGALEGVAMAVSALAFALIQRDGLIALIGYGLAITSASVLVLAAHIIVRMFLHAWTFVTAA